MATLNKSENGLIFYDNFKEPTLLWTLSPSDANNLRFGENGLTMLHNHKYTTLTITEPDAEEYSCVVEIDHLPYNYEDIGGIIVIASNKEYAECQSYLATDSSEIGNSIIMEDNINRIIQNLLNDSYVQYSLNDNEIIDPVLNENTIESSSFYENETSENVEQPFIDTFYKFIKFTKQKHKYIFWASENGIHWIEVGNIDFNNSGVIGFFLYGTTDQNLIDNSHFNVRSIAIYASRYLTIDAISEDYEFEIIDGDGQILLRTDSVAYSHIVNRHNNHCLINTATLPMPIKNAHVRTYPKEDYENTEAIYELGENVYGGDIFTLEYNIKAFIYNKEVSPTELFDLGSITRGNHYIPMIIKNCEERSFSNIKLRVTAYSEYYSGHEEIELALPIDEVPDERLKYTKSVTINELAAGTSVFVYIKLTDKMIDMFYHAASIYRFKIAIE